MSARVRRTVVPILAGSELELVPIPDQDLSGSPKLAERSCRKGLGFSFSFIQCIIYMYILPVLLVQHGKRHYIINGKKVTNQGIHFV